MKNLSIVAVLSVTLSISSAYFFSSTQGKQQLLGYVGLSSTTTPEKGNRRSKTNTEEMRTGNAQNAHTPGNKENNR